MQKAENYSFFTIHHFTKVFPNLHSILKCQNGKFWSSPTSMAMPSRLEEREGEKRNTTNTSDNGRLRRPLGRGWKPRYELITEQPFSKTMARSSISFRLKRYHLHFCKWQTLDFYVFQFLIQTEKTAFSGILRHSNESNLFILSSAAWTRLQT